ncbi:hypothetical protein [Paracoccus sp. ME4]|uniref:hypothetical protein n=1 Tax=Paracoccus sp. ME4 TaxID=3138066 RepID=UPI00398AA237
MPFPFRLRSRAAPLQASRKRAPDPEPGSHWQALLAEARNGSRLSGSSLHGEVHWRAVAATGLRLRAFHPSVSARLLLAFGMLHDCRREDEGWDPQHGFRAAEVALTSRAPRKLIDPEEIRILAKACLLHEKGKTDPEDLRVGLCWDSDRYNLLRLDIRPIQELLSAELVEADHERMIRHTIRMLDAVPERDELIDRAEAR